jgi:AraC-like DNA-binding protein
MDRPAKENFPCVRRWTYTAEADEVSFVFPDGCVDILVSSCGKTGCDLVGVTDWDFAPRQVRLSAGTSLIGYRLQPGATISQADLQIENHDLSNLGAEVGNRMRRDQEVTEIIDALGLPDSSVERLARQQGVSERTLQRHFRNLSLPTPIFWRQLGRARRAVQALPCRVPLSEIALEYGYSDQAHMTREFVRWFGRTPEQLRRNPGVMNDLAQPGLGNWSEEVALKPAGLA